MKEPFAKFVKANLGSNILLITVGLPASWKTETSEELAKIKGYTIVRTDLIRKDVLKGEDIFDEKVASNMDKRMLVYDETFRQAEELLKKGKGIIIDAN
jgi:predicted kinase